MSASLYVFGYGSLMYEPACAHRVLDVATAFLPGHARAFHLRSTARGCPDALCQGEPVEGFLVDGLRLSLVLGTCPGNGLHGRVHRYAAEHADEVLGTLRRREGDAYEHRLVEVTVDDQVLQAHTFLSRWDHPLSVELSLADQARVLRAATPRLKGERALGADYLLGVQQALGELDLPDPTIDALVDLF